MTVSAQTPINRSTGNGVTTVFPYDFKILAAADIQVTVDGVAKTLNVDYTVSGVGNDAGGNVTMTVAPANQTSVVRRRNMGLVRTTDYQDQGELPAATLDADIDATVLMIQQVDEQIGRALTLPAGVAGVSAELPEPAANAALVWNASSDAIVTKTLAELGAIGLPLSVADGGTGATAAAQARTNLGAAAAGPIGSSGITGAAASGNNNDITRLDALTTVPAVIAAYARQIQSLPDPTLSANAMTLPASTHSLDFRSATLTTGVPSTVSGTAAALVIPAGATLGTTNAVQSTLVEVIINNGGTLEKAVVNLAGGNDLSETGVISTTAISAGATAANVFYSTTARSNVPYRVVRTITSTQATAGQWATTPSLVQGAGGNALDSLQSLGYGQTWQNVLGSRAQGTTYYNTTGRPITVAFSGYSSGATGSATVNGVSLFAGLGRSTYFNTLPVFFVVPPGGSYSISNHDSVSTWAELR